MLARGKTKSKDIKSKTKRCYIYTRVSTEMQIDGYSLEAQEDYLRKEAAHRGYEVAEVFSDKGVSGKNTTNRPQFQEMLRRIANGNEDEVEYVYVFKLSRFGRNTADVMYNVQLMEDYGVKLYAVADGIDSGGPAGKMLVPVMSSVAEIERENILAQTMAGRRQKAKEGKWNGGQAPFGYYLEDGVLQIDEEEAQIVRIIYDRFLNGNMGLAGIAKWLNSHGYRKKIRGNGKYDTFTAHTVKLILDNEVYKGKIVYGKRATEKIDGTRNEFHKVKQDEGDYDVWDGLHEAIIDEVTWDAVHYRRQQTGVANERKHSPDHAHLLSGILKCPICGAGMYGRPGRKKRKDGTYYENSLNTWYYFCRHDRYVDGKPCTFGQINQKDIDGEALEFVKNALSTGGFDAAMQQSIDQHSDPDVLQQRLNIIQEQRRKAVLAKDYRALEIDQLDVNDPAYKMKREDLQERLDKFYDEIHGYDTAIEEIQLDMAREMESELTMKNAHEILQLLVANAEKGLTESELRDVIHDFIKEIRIHKKKTPDGWIKDVMFNFEVVLSADQFEFADDDTFKNGETTDETVVQLVRKNPDMTVDVTLNLEDADLTAAESKATYDQIKAYVLETFGLRVTSLQIAQTKRKLGLPTGEHYNLSQKENQVIPNCPLEKESAIREALVHFRMI